MRMDRSDSSEIQEGRGTMVVAIECLTGSSKADEWNWNMLQTGDIVEELKIGSSSLFRSPFKNGRSGIQKILHSSFKKKETLIQVRVRRGQDEFVEMQACVVPYETAGRKQYALRSIHDPNYNVGFVDRMEGDCFALQGSRSSRVVFALRSAQLQDGFVSYPWEKKMREMLPVCDSTLFLSMLLLPKASDRVAHRYNDLEDTFARANAWLHASIASGVPIVFRSVQTEALLTKISGETASSSVNAGSMSDLVNLANASLYGFEDYHGVDIGVVRAVRLWYAPVAGEVPIEIKPREGDSKLGFAISRTEEGFIYISSVIDEDESEWASATSGLRELYREAAKAEKLLVVSRLSNEKVLPWMVSSSGALRCYDTVSLSQKLSLHRHALRTIVLHVFMWEKETDGHLGLRPGEDAAAAFRCTPDRPASPPAQWESSPAVHLPPPPDARQAWLRLENRVVPLPAAATPVGNQMENRLDRDTAGEMSFRFHDFSLGNNWV